MKSISPAFPAPAQASLGAISLQLLERHFGYKRFRPGQQEVIEHVLAGHDAVVLMPTGGGKSLCYQVPALALDGLTVVVSPLIALMKDQVQALQANGILRPSSTARWARARSRRWWSSCTPVP